MQRYGAVAINKHAYNWNPLTSNSYNSLIKSKHLMVKE